MDKRLILIIVTSCVLAATGSYAVSDEIIESFPIDGDIPYGLAYDGSYFYITEHMEKTILVVDPSNGVIVDTLTLTPEPPAGALLLGAAYDGTSLWIITIGAGKKLYEVNPANGSILSELPLPEPFSGPNSNPAGITWDGTYFYVSNNLQGYTYLGAVDPATGWLVGDSWVSYAKLPNGLAFTQHEGSDYLFNVGNQDAWTFLYDTDGSLYAGEEFMLDIPGTLWWGGLTFAGSDTDLWMVMGQSNTLYHLEIDWSGHEYVKIETASFGRIKSVYR
jgi:DNA-binding beta-propeller fold protein YncE